MISDGIMREDSNPLDKAWDTKCQFLMWLRLVGSPKTQVSFAKEPYKKRPYSGKETYVLKEPTNHSHPIGLREKIEDNVMREYSAL